MRAPRQMCGARAEESEGPPASGKLARRRTRHEAASVCVPSLHAKELHLNVCTCVCSGFPGRAVAPRGGRRQGRVCGEELSGCFPPSSSSESPVRAPPRFWTARAAFAPVAVSTQFGGANPRIHGSSAGTARNSAHSAMQPNFRSVVSISLAAARDRPSGERIKCGRARSSRAGHVRLSHRRHARRQRQGSDGATRATREGGGGGGGAGRS